MVRSEHRDSRSWRARAEECRSIAETFSNPQTRARMFGVAGEYDRLAELAEQREVGAAAQTPKIGSLSSSEDAIKPGRTAKGGHGSHLG